SALIYPSLASARPVPINGRFHPARQTQDGTYGAGGFLCRCAHPTLTILSLSRSAASGWPPPGPSELQGSLRSPTLRLPASGLSFLGLLHTHRPAPASPHLCDGDASRRG